MTNRYRKETRASYHANSHSTNGPGRIAQKVASKADSLVRHHSRKLATVICLVLNLDRYHSARRMPHGLSLPLATRVAGVHGITGTRRACVVGKTVKAECRAGCPPPRQANFTRVLQPYRRPFPSHYAPGLVDIRFLVDV